VSKELNLIGLLLSDIPRMILSQEWPATEGKITSLRLVGQKFEEYDGDYYVNIDGYVHYQYSVNGIALTSSAVNSNSSPFYPSSIVSKYTVGKDVIVYYNPKNPAEAMLEPGIVYNFKAFGLVSSLMVWAGVYFVLLVGNHDVSPSVARAHAMEEFSTLSVPHVLVVDKPMFLGPDDLKQLCPPGKQLDV